MKLALILEKSDAYIAFKRKEILEAWQVSDENTKVVARFSEVGGATLFGGGLCSLLELPEIDDVKQFVKEFEASGPDLSKLEDGLLIWSPVGGNSTKRLRELVEAAGGKLYALTPEANKDKTKVAQELLQELTLSRGVKEFIQTYVGQDYESLLSLVRSLKTLTPAQQKAVTEEDIYIRLPQEPGSVAPWEIEKHIYSGNVSKTIDTYRRSTQSSSPLVTLAILNNKMRLAYKIAALMESDSKFADRALLAKTLNTPNTYPLKLAQDSARKYKKVKLEKAVELLADTERKIKGQSAADSTILAELMLVQLIDVLRSR